MNFRNLANSWINPFGQGVDFLYLILSIIGHVFYSGICQTNEVVQTLIRPLIQPMSESYLEVFDMATNSETSKEKREFFGLRDFYRYTC